MLFRSVEDEKIKKEIIHVLDVEFQDNMKAHILQKDGSYEKMDKRGKTLVSSQMVFCQEAQERADALLSHQTRTRVFVPAEPAQEEE